MNAIHSNARLARMDAALAECAKWDTAIAKIEDLKAKLIRGGQTNIWFDALKAEWELADLITAAFSEDRMKAVKDHVATRLRAEYRYDIVEGCNLDDDGEFVEAAE